MQEILSNLALRDAIAFCQDHGVDCSGSHLVKDGRGFSYTLVRTENEQPIIGVTFHKTQAPTHVLYDAA